MEIHYEKEMADIREAIEVVRASRGEMQEKMRESRKRV
jgi:hypothetical protein